MQKLIKLLFIVAVFAGCTHKQPEKPNIVFLFADDQCYNTVAAYGHPEVKTPNLDKLVENGLSFTHAYNMGAWNGAVCVASRAMINSGRMVWRAHEIWKNPKPAVENGEFWSQLMNKAGYKTYMTGKWHVPANSTEIFDTVVHERPGMPRDFFNHGEHMRLYRDSVLKGLCSAEDIMPKGYWRPTSEDDKEWLPWDKSNGGFWEGGRHWSEVLADDAKGFIDDAVSQDKPFFMYLAFNAPHDPRQAPKEFVDMYPVEELSLPENFAPEYPYDDEIGCGPDLRDAALAPFPRTEYAIKVQKQEYFALITHLDVQIGKIIKALEESGEMDNTYIFYTADHGMAVGEHGLLGKQSMYDHSMRAPLFVIGPDIPKNKKLDVDVYLQDIMASAIDLAGIEKPEYIEFSSLLPLARGEQLESNYDAIYGCYKQDLQRMVRKDGYKLILYPTIKVARLYNVDSDPLEQNDLANDEAYSERKKSLYKTLLSLQKEMDDPLDLTEVFGESL